MPFKFNPITGALDLVNTGTVTNVTATTPLFSSGGGAPNLTIQKADMSHDGYLSQTDWTIFNNKLDSSIFNFITNGTFEIDTTGWNTYDDSGRTTAASVIAQDITWTSVATGSTGNGINIEYIFLNSPPFTTPVVTVVNPTHITVAWYNGPTLAQNPTATQLLAAFNGVPAAVAIATGAITGTASKLQYITGSNILTNGGDVSPTDGTGGSPSGITFTRTTIAPIVGVGSGDLGKTAVNAQGQGVSADFTILAPNQSLLQEINFFYSASSGFVLGTSSDVRIFLYDITNAVMIPVNINYLKGPSTGTIYQYSATFTASSNSVSYRLILHNATTNASSWDLKIDNVVINTTTGPTVNVPSLVLLTQPISGAVTDHMAVAWPDGSSQWVPATQAANGDQFSCLFGFATNIIGSTANITIRGALDGFSFGPFLGFNQYVDTTPGNISPLPSPFTDTGVVMGKAISSTVLMVEPKPFFDLVGVKGGLLTNNGANVGAGDSVLAAGTTGQFLMYNTGLTLGIAPTTPIALSLIHI